MTLVVAGERVNTAFESICWLDDPKVPHATDGRARAKDTAKAIVLHTVHGKRGALKRGSKSSKRAEAYARYQAASAREVSWHFTIDTDGTVVQSADPALWLCWHAGAVNAWTVGIEIVQDPDGTLYDATLASVVALCELLCASLAIPRRLPVDAQGKPSRVVLAALTGARGPWAGVFGHRNQTRNRGPGDPGDQPFDALLRAGFTGVHLDAAPPALPVTPPKARKPAPKWLDPAAEIDATKDLPRDQRAFVLRHLAELRALGLDDARAFELIAHVSTECDFGRREHGHNAGGVKALEGDAEAYERTYGGEMPWWRSAGHVASGDAPEVYYRGWTSSRAFWEWWLRRFVPRVSSAASARYTQTGLLFWSQPGPAWIVEMIRAGYRGVVREREIAELLAAGGDGTAHSSVRAHVDLVRRVRELAGAP